MALFLVLALPGPTLAHPELEAQIQHLGTELAERPGDAELWLKRADLHRRHGDLDAAREDLDAAARLAPPAELDFYRGRLLMDAGEPEAADRAFSAYLSARPGHVKTLALRASVRAELGRFPDAADDLSQAIDLSEHPSPSLYRRQVGAQVQAGAHHWLEARRTADRGLERFPSEISLLGLATDLSLALIDAPAADAYLERLPPSLGELPRWRARLQLARELAAAGPSPPSSLSERVRRNLLEGIDPP
ncbi:MAG: tetratricopeptide repeat protein [Xanthomonadales bacterium]|nr:tetratricopeptide repeat protein [Xanthomonadales bacterium]